MTQIPVSPSLSGFTPEQMQAMINFFFQHQPGAVIPAGAHPNVHGAGSAVIGSPLSTGPPTGAPAEVQLPSAVNGDGSSAQTAEHAGACPPTPVKTPPRRKAVVVPPSTPRAPGNTPNARTLPQSAASTPSSKMAQLTLDGRKLSSTPSKVGTRNPGGVSASTRQGPLPTGYDSLLLYEDPPSDFDPDATHAVPPTDDAKEQVDGEESDPYEGFPAIVTAPPPPPDSSDDKMDTVQSFPISSKRKASGPRRKRNEPTTARWMSTRRTRTSSDGSPPPIQGSPTKKARVASPTVSPVHSPPAKDSACTDETMGSPFESPGDVNSSDVRALERLLDSVRQGVKIPALTKFIKKAQAAEYIDNEARCSDGEDDEDESGNLKDFVVADDVVEYDADAPALPDDDDHRPRRIHRRRNTTEVASGDGYSDVEIVPNPQKSKDKGKARADPPPPSPPLPPVPGPSGTSRDDVDLNEVQNGDADRDETGRADHNAIDLAWQGVVKTLSNAPRGFHPGSSAVDARAPVCPPLVLTAESPLFSWDAFKCEALDNIGYYENTTPVPGDCGIVLSDYNDNGWGTPSVDIVAAAETHVHLPNLIRAMKFRRRGPYINEAQVDPEDIIAVDVSPPSGTKRYKFVIKDTRAPAVSITTGVVRYFRLDRPSSGPHPVYYINVTPFDGNFDRSVGLQGLKFGQRELYCMSFNNAIRMTTLPAFEGPTEGSGKAKPSSSIRRGKSSGQPSRRGANFELSTNDVVPILDARRVPLPDDISTWTTVLPPFEGTPPRDAVAAIAHTTNMWVGTRSTPTSYNLQYNLLFIVILGTLPVGFV